MARCNDLCTKDATGTCALCEARAEADRFIRVWFKGGWLVDGAQALRHRKIFACLERWYGWLVVRLGDQSKAPGCWFYPVPQTEVRHQAVVREAHKQYSETVNKTMLTLLGLALFCVLTTLGSPDTWLLAASSTIKIPFTDAPMPFLGFLVVAPCLLIVLFIYLHVFYGYWLACEQERRYINQRLIPPLASIPTLFSLPDAVPRWLTGFVFYWLVPLVLSLSAWKASALPCMGLFLRYVTGVVAGVAIVLYARRQKNLWFCSVLAVILVHMALVTFTPRVWQRPFWLFRVDLAKAWLPRIKMQHAVAVLVNFQEANLFKADLQRANLRGADFQQASLWRANLQDAWLTGAKHLTQEQLNTACVFETTHLPEGLLRPDPCPAEP
jgi:Pentapeptide repeats (8 copies)